MWHFDSDEYGSPEGFLSGFPSDPSRRPALAMAAPLSRGIPVCQAEIREALESETFHYAAMVEILWRSDPGSLFPTVFAAPKEEV